MSTNKRKLIAFSDRQLEMVDEVKSVKGYPSFSSVIHAAVVELHTRTFPNYMRPLARDESPAEKVARKTGEKKAKEAIAKEAQMEILRQLDGSLVVEQGNEFALYFTYTGKKRFEQKVPLSLLSTDMVRTQYQPSRERVEELQKEGKVDYVI